MSGLLVTVENFVRAETDRMFSGGVGEAGGINRWSHRREPASLDKQFVIRMNRDTLYSLAVVDIAGGATLTVPDSGSRYLSVMAVNQDHYINRVFHQPGEYELTVDDFGTPYLALAARVLVDPGDPADVATVHALQTSSTFEPSRQGRSRRPSTTRQASTRPARRCSSWRAAFEASVALSAREMPSIPCFT